MKIKHTADLIRCGWVIVGKDNVIELCMVAMLCEGHVLLEDVPGIGKTTLAKALARSIGCSFRRIQFTPDLLPSDVTGILYLIRKDKSSSSGRGRDHGPGCAGRRDRQGHPPHAECTVGGDAGATGDRRRGDNAPSAALYRVGHPKPNRAGGHLPLAQGTDRPFPDENSPGLPQRIGRKRYPAPLRARGPPGQAGTGGPGGRPAGDATTGQGVLVEESVRDYVVKVVRATREHAAVELGVSPRGTLALYKTAQALAALRDRQFVIPDDVKYLAPPVLTHRIIISPQTRLRGRRPEEVMAEIVETVPVPVEK